jgi:hypothetical protein
MAFFALQYELADDFVARRVPYRAEHLRLLTDLQGHGEVVLAGAFAEPVDRALLIFSGSDREIAESFARRDPYVVNGLVKRWEVRLWTVVVGG